jgi:hypothetical protein
LKTIVATAQRARILAWAKAARCGTWNIIIATNAAQKRRFTTQTTASFAQIAYYQICPLWKGATFNGKL